MDKWQCLDCGYILSNKEVEEQLDREDDIECPVCEGTNVDLSVE